jgi:DNA-binding transcriptional regulator YhcF (GntR family)
MNISQTINWIPNYISSLPLDRQLVELVQRKVMKQEIKKGDTLPTPSELSAKSYISRRTIEQAYSRLQLLGVLDNGKIVKNVLPGGSF